METDTEPEELVQVTSPNGNTKFSMKAVTVDGITSHRPKDLIYDNLMVSYKTMDDPGLSYRWFPDVRVSEQHWLDYGHIAYVTGFCGLCGKSIDE